MPRQRVATYVTLTGLALGVVLVAPVTGASAAAPTLPAALTAYLQADRSGEQWSLTATHAAAAWTKATGAGVTVATVDTGVDGTRPDLSGKLVAGAHLADDGTTIVSGSRTDLDGHGTHVAGIIAGNNDGHGITGIAPGAKILPVNVDTTFLTGAAVGNGIRWGVDHGAKVINVSLGLDDVPLFADDITPVCNAAAYAESKGVVVVAAAGNDGEGTNLPEAPAACTDVLSVAALDSSMHVTSWSSFDGTIDLAAPGGQIYSTLPEAISSTGYGLESGTSMAAPFVAGVAALLMQEHPTWTPAQVRSRLETTAEDTGPAGFDPRNGFGAVDPAAAVGATAPAPAATPALSANAIGFGDHFDSDNNLVINQTLVSWVPDPSAVVTGYTVTTYAAGGTTVKSLPATTVRWATSTTTGGYVVTAQTASGPITAPPVWYSSIDVGGNTFQVLPVQKLKATYTAAGSLVVSWVNPAANTGHADGVFVSLNGDTVTQHFGTVPTHLTVPAAHVPAGDLTVDVFVQSSNDGTFAVTHILRNAQFAFSSTGARVGGTHYRVTLQLASSWGKRACGSAHCNGVALKLVYGKKTYTDYLDEHGQAVFTVAGKARLPYLLVKVSSSSSKYKKLNVARIHVKLSVLPKK